MSDTTQQDFAQLNKLKVPVKRAAYSDRTAWTMAILAELAYIKLDEEHEKSLPELALELAALSGSVPKITDRLKDLIDSVTAARAPDADADQRNQVLRDALAVGGFELVGAPLYDAKEDTQGYVVVRPADPGPAMAVICFRGTKERADWLTNVDIRTQPIDHPNEPGTVIGNMHRGFYDAYKAVEDQIADCLAGHDDLPLYITGHSLGGALAVIATWFQSSARLAACYTFGAPRAGDTGLVDQFRTPIYRLVNVADPVPFVPPSGRTIHVLKVVARFFKTVLPVFGVADWGLQKLIKVQKFRHYGDMRYLTPAGRVEPAVSSGWRFLHFLESWYNGKAQRIDKYHAMARYRTKLRARAIERNKWAVAQPAGPEPSAASPTDPAAQA